MKVINKKIDIICWFDKDGNPKPLRFRISDKDGINNVIKIDNILTVSSEKLAGNQMLVFECQGIINGILKRFVIKYELSTCKWILFKI